MLGNKMDIIRFILRLPYFLFCICLEACLYFLLFLLIVLKAILWFFSPIIGQINWSVPKWYPRSKEIYQATLNQINRYSILIGSIIFFGIIAYVGGNYTYHWYLNRPKPVEPAPIIINTYGISYIQPTESGDDLDKKENINLRDQNNPTSSLLKIRFTGNNRSPAPIDMINKAISEGIEISPNIDGIWTWHNDKEIYFKPTQPWPLSTVYTVKLDNEKLLNSHSLINERDKTFSFTTKGFSYKIGKEVFYQNPTDEKEKLALFEVLFSHPVAKETFESKIKLALYEKSTEKYKPNNFVKNLNYTITYDTDNRIAYIKSERVDFANVDRYLTLEIDQGVASIYGGKSTETDTWNEVKIPNKYNLNINSADISLVELSTNEMRQVLTVNLNYNVKASDLQKGIMIWQLPTLKDKRYSEKYYDQIDGRYKMKYFIDKSILAKSKQLSAKLIDSEDDRTYRNKFSFELNGDQSSQLYITIDPSLTSEGGYTLKEKYKNIITVAEYPKVLKFAASGSLMALSGDKKIPVTSRNISQIKLSLNRLIPSQLQHLVSDNINEFSHMRFDDLRQDNFVEKYAIEKTIKGSPQSIKYTDFDLTSFLREDVKTGMPNHGIFLLNLYAKNENYRPQDSYHREEYEAEADDYEEYVEYDEENVEYIPYDSRFIIVTDLGIISKKSLDQSYDLFVQSISSGDPVADAKVSILGANGIEITSQQTDSTGHVHFAALSDYYKGIKPLLFLIEKDDDMSFLPITKGYRGNDRKLNYSRFDVGGQYETLDHGELHTHLFSDRGMYRPGDTFHIGVIVRAEDWNKSLNKIRVEADIYDPKYNLVTTKTMKLDEYAFNEFSYQTSDSSPTGQWYINLFLKNSKKDEQRVFLGSTSVIIREFEPDKTTVTAQIIPKGKQGWIKQSDLQALVTAKNLFGTPAQNRTVESTLYLKPTIFKFKQYNDYDFFRYHDYDYKNNFKIELDETDTNEEGIAKIDLHIDNFNGQYEAQFLADVYESLSGRTVSATDSVLISSDDYLIGGKADGTLDYIKRDSKRLLKLIAINPELEQIGLNNLKLVTLEQKYLSVLVKQPSGLYKYESKRKDVPIGETRFEIDEKGTTYQIPTDKPGNYLLQLINNQNKIVYQAKYTVAGSGNITRSLERNAELSLKIDGNQYKAGQEIEVSITAPYVGSGIITIERDKVYAWKWFKTDTTSSVQKITLPKEVEGNAYINVQFVRDPNSEEVFMSPLSYGVIPFSVSSDKFVEKVSLVTPNLIKPGDTIPITLKTNNKQRAIVFAVDEGILQVAGYHLKNPLKDFIRKKALSVRTDQILDLILPEYNRLLNLSAAGGDDEGANANDLLNAHLNPFKRKTDKPIVFWSGIVDVNGEKEFNYTVPDYFSGKIRIMAITVGKQTMGIAQSTTTVRNDFVLTPNIPYFVTPNDEFEISLSVANNLTEIGDEQIPIKVSLTTTPQLTVIDEPNKTIKLASMKEGTLSFRLKANETLGSGDLHFTATYQDKEITRQVSTSVRPMNPYRLKTIMGRMDGKTQTIKDLREMYPELSEQDAAVSYSPMILVKGLTDYLDNYEYYCSEQIVSRTLPLLIANKYPEFNLVTKKTLPLDGVLQKLQSRQNSDGAIGLWYPTYNVHPYVSLYVVHFLLEAKDAGIAVPSDLLTNANKYLQAIASGEQYDVDSLRERAYAIYLLTRQNIITTNQIASIVEYLNYNKNKWWQTDIIALYLASSYKMLKMDKQAEQFLKPVWKELSRAYDNAWWNNKYYDPLVISAVRIYLITKHFGEKAKDIPAQALENMVLMLNQERYTTQSSAMMMLALDGYISSINANQLNEDDLTITGTTKSDEDDKKMVAIAKLQKLLAKGKFTDATTSISFHNKQDLPAWYLMSQKGFDRTVQTQPITKGLEIYREFTDSKGNPISAVQLGDTINVTVRIRSLAKEGQTNIAIVDMLPGGFEVVQQKAKSFSSDHDNGDNDDLEESDYTEAEDENDYDPADQWISPIAVGKYTWYPDYTDVREDRVIIYGSTANNELQTFKYQIKATNVGEYSIPPAFGEAMYNRDIQAVSKGGGKISILPR